MSSGAYKEAIDLLTKAFKYDDANVDALYYLGRSYQFAGNKEEAKKCLDQVISDFPDSRRVAQAEEHLKELN
jgi:tetratricopeptide (TPR) repeat protein